MQGVAEQLGLVQSGLYPPQGPCDALESGACQLGLSEVHLRLGIVDDRVDPHTVSTKRPQVVERAHARGLARLRGEVADPDHRRRRERKGRRDVR